MIYLTVKEERKNGNLKREPVKDDHVLALQKFFFRVFPFVSSVLYVSNNRQVVFSCAIQTHTQPDDAHIKNSRICFFFLLRWKEKNPIWHLKSETERHTQKLSPVKVNTQEDERDKEKKRAKRFANLPASPDKKKFPNLSKNMSQTPG